MTKTKPKKSGKFNPYKIRFIIVLQGCPKKGGGVISHLKKTRLQKAAPIKSHMLLRCQVVLMQGLFVTTLVYSIPFFGLVRF